MWCSLPVNTQHRRLGGLVVEGIVQLAHLDLVLKVLGRVLQVLLEPRVATPEVERGAHDDRNHGQEGAVILREPAGLRWDRANRRTHAAAPSGPCGFQ